MSGGRLRIDYLIAGAVVKPFEVMDAVSKGVLIVTVSPQLGHAGRPSSQRIAYITRPAAEP